MEDNVLQRLLKLTPTIMAILLVLVLFIWLTIGIKEVLSPTILTIIIIAILLPFQKENRTIRILIGAILFLYVAWFISLIASSLLPFVIALILAYIFDPVVTFLVKKGLSRTMATVVLMLVLFLIFVIILLIIIPTLVHEISVFIDQIPEIKAKTTEWINSLQTLDDRKIPQNLRWLKKILEYQIPPKIQEIVDTLLTKLKESVPLIAQKISSLVTDIFSNIIMFIIGLLQMLIIPILMFYILKETPEIKFFVVDLLPEKYEPLILSILFDINLALSNFLRGQITVACIVGTLTGIWLFIIGIKFSLLIGVVAGVCNLIPFLGAIISSTLSVVMALFSPDPILSIGLIIIGFPVIGLLESAVISPRILGHSLKLNPALIMFAIIVGGHLRGIFGMLLAIPSVCVLKVFFDRWYKTYKEKERLKTHSEHKPREEGKEEKTVSEDKPQEEEKKEEKTVSEDKPQEEEKKEEKTVSEDKPQEEEKKEEKTVSEDKPQGENSE